MTDETLLSRFAPLAGRISLSLIFVEAGFRKIGAWERTAAAMAAKGLPLVPVLLPLVILLEIGGGLLLILGVRARAVAAAFFAYLVALAVIFHPFWAVEPAQQSQQLTVFLLHVAVMGGMLYVIAFGAGPLSLDRSPRA